MSSELLKEWLLELKRKVEIVRSTPVKCGTCDFYHDRGADGHEGGFCLCKPPVVLPNGETVFPETTPDLRCGAHEFDKRLFVKKGTEE